VVCHPFCNGSSLTDHRGWHHPTRRRRATMMRLRRRENAHHRAIKPAYHLWYEKPHQMVGTEMHSRLPLVETDSRSAPLPSDTTGWHRPCHHRSSSTIVIATVNVETTTNNYDNGETTITVIVSFEETGRMHEDKLPQNPNTTVATNPYYWRRRDGRVFVCDARTDTS
jgi:hypothetical protein